MATFAGHFRVFDQGREDRETMCNAVIHVKRRASPPRPLAGAPRAGFRNRRFACGDDKPAPANITVGGFEPRTLGILLSRLTTLPAIFCDLVMQIEAFSHEAYRAFRGQEAVKGRWAQKYYLFPDVPLQDMEVAGH